MDSEVDKFPDNLPPETAALAYARGYFTKFTDFARVELKMAHVPRTFRRKKYTTSVAEVRYMYHFREERHEFCVSLLFNCLACLVREQWPIGK